MKRLTTSGGMYSEDGGRTGYLPMGGALSSVPCGRYNELCHQFITVCRRLSDYENAEENDGWISVQDRMPDEHDSIFAKWYGTERWKESMFRKTSNDVIVTVMFGDKKKLVTTMRTHDGEFKNIDISMVDKQAYVTHWRSMPDAAQDKNDVENGIYG